MGQDASKLALYVGTPFFAYPHKPIMNQYIGSSYDVAYKHFRRDHADSLNLAMHLACMCFQLTYNFGLLAEIDKGLGLGFDPVATSSMAMWIGTLFLHSNAPVSVKIASGASIFLAYRLRDKIQDNWEKFAWIQSILEVRALQIFVLDGAKVGEMEYKSWNIPQFIGLLAARLLIQVFVKQQASTLINRRAIINTVLFAFLLQTCRDPFQSKPPPFLLGLVGWALAYMTNQKWLFFLSGGFAATFAQGVSHYTSQELATMPQLTSLADEYAHATYFPNLVYQSIYHSMMIQ